MNWFQRDFAVSRFFFQWSIYPRFHTLVINFGENKVGHISVEKATLACGSHDCVLVGWKINPQSFGIGVEDFAIAGALMHVVAIGARDEFLGIWDNLRLISELLLTTGASIVPIAFPLIAVELDLVLLFWHWKQNLEQVRYANRILLNLIFVYAVLNKTNWLERKLGKTGLDVFWEEFWNYFAFQFAVKILNQNVFSCGSYLNAIHSLTRFLFLDPWAYDLKTRWRSQRQSRGRGGLGAVLKFGGH